MALLLRPGDPLPALDGETGRLDPRLHAGRYWAIATGPQTALAALPGDELPVVQVHARDAAQRLGADFVGDVPRPLVVLLDPAGTVVHSWADAPLPELLAKARAQADQLAGK